MADIKRITGFSLTEVLVVLAIAALLAGLGIPAAKEIFNTFESSAGVKSVINAALRNARAIAIKDGKYAGVRFQQDVDGRQYLIFVVNDPKPYVSDGDLAIDPTLTGTGIANGFRAIEGLKPIKLPKSVGLMDLRIRLDYGDPAVSTDEPIEDVSSVDESNLNIDDDEEVTDTTTFSIVFSPAGKLVTHNVRVKNKHGQWDQTVDSFPDDIFNIMEKVDAGDAMFYQDDYAADGLGEESSRKGFVIYDKDLLTAVGSAYRWEKYLQNLEVIYLNPYTGEIVNR